MGFIMLNGVRYYDRVDGKYKHSKIGLQLTETFRKSLNFHKARNSFRCSSCDIEKPKNTRYLGNDNWNRICMDCVDKWIDSSFETLKEIVSILEKDRVELLANKDKWRREAILGAVS